MAVGISSLLIRQRLFSIKGIPEAEEGDRKVKRCSYNEFKRSFEEYRWNFRSKKGTESARFLSHETKSEAGVVEGCLSFWPFRRSAHEGGT